MYLSLNIYLSLSLALSLSLYIYIYIYREREREIYSQGLAISNNVVFTLSFDAEAVARLLFSRRLSVKTPDARPRTPNLPTNIMDFRGFDSSII